MIIIICKLKTPLLIEPRDTPHHSRDRCACSAGPNGKPTATIQASQWTN